MVILTTSCIKEKLSHCEPGVYITYYYNHNKQYTNLFENEVDRLEIFIFDNSNTFYKKYVFTDTRRLTNNHQINLPLPQGNWTIVTWGGYLTDYNITELTPGVDKLDDLILTLKPDKIDSDTGIEINHSLIQLFHGEITKITTYEDKYTYAKIPLRKNISTINLKITGLDLITRRTKGLLPEDFNIKTVLNNDRHIIDNSIAPNSKDVTYTCISQASQSVLNTSHNVMRLMVNDKSGNLIIGSNYLEDGGINIPLIESIMQNPNYKNQDDLDREDTYDFTISLKPIPGNTNSIKVTIIINSWEVINVITGITKSRI